MYNGIAKFIYKLFGFDVDVYNKFANRNDQFIFTSKPKLYLYLKFGTFIGIFLSAAVFIYLYCVILYSHSVNYPYYLNNKEYWSSGEFGMQDVASRSWVYLVFAVIYCFSAIKLWNLLWSLRKKNNVQRQNILYSFDYIFFMTAAIIVIVRFSLYFSVDQMQYYLNPTILKQTYEFNAENIMNVTMIAVGYYWVVIVTILNFLFILLCFIFKPLIKKDVKQKMNEAQQKYANIMKDTMNGTDNVLVYLPKALIPTDENGNISLRNNEELVLNGTFKNDNNSEIIQITNLENKANLQITYINQMNKKDEIIPNKDYLQTTKNVISSIEENLNKINPLNSIQQKNKTPKVIKIINNDK